MNQHGMSKTRFHRIWSSVLSRCNNPNHSRYKYYGGRGIQVSERWLHFLNFKADMYESYLLHVEEFGEKNTTIDRIDFNGNYSADNCKWATLSEQAKNKRKRPVRPKPEKLSRHGRTYIQKIKEDGREVFMVVRRSDGAVLNKIYSKSI